ncbi:MAG: TAT-variant-translocated molybdopterin oxidoreductase, partial [Pirellula sp.]
MSLTGKEHQQRYFRSIDELQQTTEFQQFVTREFPQAASEFPEGVSRRRWIQMMGASLALGGVAGCRYHREEIGAFVVRPEGRVPGLPEYFATNFEWAGSVVNALIANIEGRPIKVDGNPDHPAYANSQPKNFTENKKLRSAGTTAMTQASILSLYDQDRVAFPLLREKLRSAPKKFSSEEAANKSSAWDALAQYIDGQKKVLAESQGEGLAIVFEPTQSPSLRRALADVKAMYPKATLVKYESVYSGKVGKALDAVGAAGATIGLNLDSAKVIVSLDADLFGADANSVHNARQFANHRSPDGDWVNRLYVIESQYSVTGSAADFRLALQSRQMAALLKKIEAAIDAGTVVEDKIEDTVYNKLDDAGKVARIVECIASDLLSHKGESALCVGTHLDLNVQLAALRINQKLGNIGKTVNIYLAPDELANVSTLKLDEFVNQAAAFKSVWILASNPVFTVPGDLTLATAIEKIKDSVYLGNHDDETAELCQWTVPASHPFEAWGDIRNVDGTYGVGQPLIDPLLDSKSPIEFLVMLAGLSVASGQQYVME